MQSVDNLNPPLQYHLIWLLLGVALALAIIGWYGLLFWLTRKQQVKMLGTLKQLPSPVNLDSLKQKYTILIQQLYKQYQDQEIPKRELHIQLSSLIRYFVYEANGFPAPLLTLSDIRHTSYSKLAKIISQYYPEEFAEVSSGDATDSTQNALGFVAQWPF